MDCSNSEIDTRWFQEKNLPAFIIILLFLVSLLQIGTRDMTVVIVGILFGFIGMYFYNKKGLTNSFTVIDLFSFISFTTIGCIIENFSLEWIGLFLAFIMWIFIKHMVNRLVMLYNENKLYKAYSILSTNVIICFIVGLFVFSSNGTTIVKNLNTNEITILEKGNFIWYPHLNTKVSRFRGIESFESKTILVTDKIAINIDSKIANLTVNGVESMKQFVNISSDEFLDFVSNSKIDSREQINLFLSQKFPDLSFVVKSISYQQDTIVWK